MNDVLHILKMKYFIQELLNYSGFLLIKFIFIILFITSLPFFVTSGYLLH